MTSETIHISTRAGDAEAYVSRPDTGAHPAVLLYVDAIGLRPQIERMADRIAAWGYVVMAPHVFHRDGTAAELAPTTDLTLPGNREAFFEGAMARVRAHGPEQSDPDLDSYVEAIRALSGVTGRRIGVTGYCMGGRLALRAAGLRPDAVAAVGVFHAAGLVTEADDSPHRLVAGAQAEVLAGHADRDGSNPPEAIAALDEALTAAGIVHTTAVYPGAPHGYTMDDTSMYDRQSAERHFRELEDLFGRVLTG